MILSAGTYQEPDYGNAARLMTRVVDKITAQQFRNQYLLPLVPIESPSRRHVQIIDAIGYWLKTGSGELRR